MTKVKVTISGALDLRAANIDGEDLFFDDDVAEVKLADGEHVLFWQVRGQAGTPFTVMVKPGLKDAISRKTSPAHKDDTEVTFVIPEPKPAPEPKPEEEV